MIPPWDEAHALPVQPAPANPGPGISFTFATYDFVASASYKHTSFVLGQLTVTNTGAFDAAHLYVSQFSIGSAEPPFFAVAPNAQLLFDLTPGAPYEVFVSIQLQSGSPLVGPNDFVVPLYLYFS